MGWVLSATGLLMRFTRVLILKNEQAEFGPFTSRGPLLSRSMRKTIEFQTPHPDVVLNN